MIRPPLSAVGEILGIGRRLLRGLRGGRPSRGAMAVVLDTEGRLLLVRSVYRRAWSPPGGFLADDEDPVAGALRELWEETGLRGEGRLVHVMSRRGHVEHVVFADRVSGEASRHSWEVGELAWARPGEVRRTGSVATALLAGAGGVLAVRDGRFVPGAGAVPVPSGP